MAELLAARGVRIDPSSIDAWVQEFAPRYEAAARSCRRTVGERWSVDETYVKVAGDCMSLITEYCRSRDHVVCDSDPAIG